jgi:hypothetical protein
MATLIGKLANALFAILSTADIPANKQRKFIFVFNPQYVKYHI